MQAGLTSRRLSFREIFTAVEVVRFSLSLEQWLYLAEIG